jgi:acylphosphatase
MIVCKRVYYSGRVQGVGFRYTTENLARNFAVTGFVRNLPSGDVELVSEGEAEEVQRFLDALAARMARYIQQQKIQDETPAGYQQFLIRA